jgi:hypothetical protein
LVELFLPLEGNMPFFESKESFIPKKLRFIHDMLISRFKALSIDKNDRRIAHLMNDSYISDPSKIFGVYIIYRKSILDILDNKYNSFDSYEFKQAHFKDRTVSQEDVEDVLDISILVVIASDDGKHISNYYIGGSSEILNSFLNVCLGFPKNTNPKFYKNTISVFTEDVKIVKNMGYLDNIVNEKA